MSKVKIELISDGVKELLKSEAIASECKTQADAVCGRCGEGYEVEARVYHERAGYIIKPVSSSAIKDNLDNNTLLKAANI